MALATSALGGAAPGLAHHYLSKKGNQGSKATGKSLMGNATGDQIPEGYSKGSLQQFTPEQMQLFQRLFSQISPDSYTSKLAQGDEDTFNQIEAPALRQHNELLGGLASRFSGMGGLGARKSSGFQNTATAASSNFAQQLQSNRQQLQRQALQDLMGISNSLLGQRPKENFLAKDPQKENSFLEQLLLGLSGGVGQGIGQAGAAFLGGG